MRHRTPVACIAALALTLPALPSFAAGPLPLGRVNDPPLAPHALTAFPARDFVSADGLTPGDTVVFEVTHPAARGGETVVSLPFVVGDDGLAEVNHPGGTCWDVVTPNIVAGDTVRAVVTDSPGGVRTGDADVTHVADIVAGRPVTSAPGTVVIRGTAVGTDGAQLAADQLDARLVSPGGAFARSGRRDLRAPGTRGATIGYDQPGSTTDFGWTASWTGLNEADVQLALGAEGMGAWLGRDPAAGTESTIFETGAGIANGPQAPCTAPKERLAPLPGEDAEPPTVPTGLTAVVSDLNSVTLSWDASMDDVGVTTYGIYRNGVPVFTVQKPDASAGAPTSFVDRNVPPGHYTYVVDAGDAMDNRSAGSVPAEADAQARPAGTVPVSNPPTHPFTIFPSRDMINVEGLVDGQLARVEVIRAGRVVSDSTGLIPDATGLVEINHVGGYCWAGTTPDIRPGDAVRATVYQPDGTVAWADEATTANVTAGKAFLLDGVVTIQGSAADHTGAPLPAEQLEQRLVSSSKNLFGANGKRTLRADAGGAGQGTLAYDPVGPDNPLGVRWTARYPGLDATDQALSLAVESRIMWLGREALAGLELTIFEVGGADPPGPAGPDCAAPFEAADTSPPTTPELSATAVVGAREVDLAWTPSTDDTSVYGYRIYQDDRAVAVVAGDRTSWTAGAVAPGTHSFSIEAFDSASPLGVGTTDVERVQAGLGRPYGNTSTRSAGATVTSKDVQAPSVPGNLQVTNPTTIDPATGQVTGTREARVVFDPSTDDGGTAPTYEIFRDGVLLTGAVTSPDAEGRLVFVDQELTTGDTYRFSVRARDAADNVSARTAEVSVTIAADTQAPVFVGLPTATVPDVHGRDVVVSWTAATDDIGVTGYGIYRDGVRISQVDGATSSFRVVGLAPGTYGFTVDATDSAGNRSDASNQPPQTAAIASDPPSAGHGVIVYPARDFVEGSGYTTTDATGATVGQTVVVEVLRRGVVVGQAMTTADSTGMVEVNHAGPGCWGTAAFAGTPDIRPGDVARITPVATGVPDQTTAARVYVGRPVQTGVSTVVVRGTAATESGTPLPLDQLEARAISSGAEFRLNGRHALLAPGDGVLAYDAAGSTAWTATFTGLAAADVSRVLASEMVVNWLGRAPLTGNELTIYENGPGTDGGPAAGSCTAPLDPTAPLVALAPAARLDFGTQLAVPASTGAARTVTLSNAGSTPVSLRDVYLGGANPGDFVISATPASVVPPGGKVTVQVSFSPKAVGARSATLSFTDDAANTSYQTIQLTGTGTDASAPSTPSGFARALVQGSTIVTSVPVRLSWNTSTGQTTRYQLQRSLAGGAFADVPANQQPAAAVVDPATGAVTTPASTSVTLPVTTGSATRFQVRACNGTNCSAWTALAAFTLAPFQENNAAVTTRGTWTRTALAGSFGGSVRSSSVAGATVTLKTAGTGFQVVSTRGPDRGNAEVWVDGVRVATVSLYAATVTPAQVVYTREGLANTTHQVELRTLGTRTAPSTGNRVDLDGFIALR